MKKLKFIITLILLCVISNIAQADDYDYKIKDLQEQIYELKKIINSNKSNSKNDIINGLKVEGRIHVNGSWYKKNQELKSYNTDSDYNDKFSIKRARLTISKEIKNFLFQIEGNFDGDNAYLGETFIGYKINNEMTLKFGQIISPSFIEREKSSNTMATIDSNAIEQLGWIPEYLIGLNYLWKSDKFGLSTGIFGNGTNNENELENDMNYNLSFRTFYTPIRNYNYVVHFGLDLSYQNYRKNKTDNPEQISQSYYYGLELAFKYKFMTLTNEYIKNYYKYEKDRFNGNIFNFYGLSSEFTINLTGEITSYNNAGYFDEINVKHPISKGGFGAFQTVFRYSFANGKDISHGFLDNIGTKYDYTIGLTWIPENNIRLLINYSKNFITAPNYSYKGKYDAFKIELRAYF